MDNNNIFLTEFSKRLEEGEFDKYLTMPLLTKNLIYFTAKGRITRRLEKGGTPLLTEIEILNVIEESRIIAAETFNLFIDSKILEKTDTGYDLTSKGELSIGYSRMKKR